MSGDGSQVSVEGREASPGWHLKAVLIIVVLLALAYVVAVNLVLK